MTYVVSITSQGQISIPTKIRRQLGVVGATKAFVSEENGRVVVEPVSDILSTKGALSGYALKEKTAEEILKLEKNAWEKQAVTRYQKTLTKTR